MSDLEAQAAKGTHDIDKKASKSGSSKVPKSAGCGGRQVEEVYSFGCKKWSVTPLLIHNSDQNILAARFAPSDPKQLITCGRENIRFWRVGKTHLSHCPVVLNQTTRNSIFTCFDFSFERPTGGSQATPAERRNDQTAAEFGMLPPTHLYVGTKNGLVFKVNYQTREVDGVHKVAEGAVCALTVREKYCVTASEDKFVRVWTLGFPQALLETSLDSSVVALGVDLECSKVLAGTYEGGLTFLDLAKQTCRTYLTPMDPEISFVVKLGVQRILTLGARNVISVWDGIPLTQSYEFECGKDECLALTAIDDHTFVGGFNSGATRIFNINKLAVVHERAFHKAPVVAVAVGGTSDRLMVAGDSSGIYSLVQLGHGLELTGYLEVDKVEAETAQNSKDKPLFGVKVSASFSPSLASVAVISRDNKSVNLYCPRTKKIQGSIWMGSVQPHTVQFSKTRDSDLFVLTCEQSIRIYFVSPNDRPVLFQEILGAHGGFVSGLIPIHENRVFLTTGGDGLLKLWGIYSEKEIGCKEFGAHSGPVYTVAWDEASETVYSGGGPEGVCVWALHFDLKRFSEDRKKVVQHQTAALLAPETAPGTIQEKGREILDSGKENFEPNKIGDSLVWKLEEAAPEPAVLKRYPEALEKETKKPSPGKVQAQTSSHPSAPVSKVRSVLTYTKSPIQEPAQKTKNKKTLQETDSGSRRQLVLGRTHYSALDEVPPAYKPASLALPNSLTLRSLSGINTCSSFNILWSQKHQNIVYINENKLVLESTTAPRTQKVFHLPQTLSCIRPSQDWSRIYAGSLSNPGELLAPVYVLNLSDLSWDKAEHHRKGVQCLSASPDNAFLISVGTANDRRVVVSHLSSKRVVHNSLLAHPAYDCLVQNYGQAGHYFAIYTTKNGVKILTFSAEAGSKVEEADRILNPVKFFDVEINCLAQVAKPSETAFQLFFGTSHKQVVVADFVPAPKLTEKSFRVTHKFDPFESEVVGLFVCRENRELLVAAAEGKMAKICLKDIQPKTDVQFNSKKVVDFGEPLSSVACHSEGTKALAVLATGDICYADLGTANNTHFIGNIDQKDPIVDLKVVAGEYLVSLTQSGQVSLWLLKSAEKLCALESPSSVAALSTLGSRLRLWCHGGEVAEFDLAGDLDVYSLYRPDGPPPQFINAFDGETNDRNLTVLASQGGSVWVGNWGSQEQNIQVTELELPMTPGKITDVKMSPSGALAVATNKNEVWVFRSRPSPAGLGVFELWGHFDSKVTKKYDFQWASVAFDPKSDDLWAIFNNCPQVVVWRAADQSV